MPAPETMPCKAATMQEHGAAAQEEASERWEPGAWTDDLQAAGCAPAIIDAHQNAASRSCPRQPPRPSELVDRDRRDDADADEEDEADAGGSRRKSDR